ncbi:MAG: hypothetical protein IKR01_00880, partial [Spirochaetales bacterium]|nr:hypothetical protein [Spirochaetales bacterium]
RGGKSLSTLTIISVVVGAAGLVVGIVQLVLMIIQSHKGKKNTLCPVSQQRLMQESVSMLILT